MLKDTDIKKLKKIFATKEDLRKFATKKDLKKFATKEDLKIYATKKDLEEMVEKIVLEITEIVGSLGENIEKSLQELRSHRIILGDHEEKIKHLEKITLSRF